MDEYQLFDITKEQIESLNSDQISNKLNNILFNKLLNLVNRIKDILNLEVDSKEKLHAINSLLNEMIKILYAYKRLVNNKCDINFESEFKALLQKYFQSPTVKDSLGNDIDAFKVLNVFRNRCDDTQLKKIQEMALKKIKFSFLNKSFDNLQSFNTFAKSLQKILWAYNKICTPEKIQEYLAQLQEYLLKKKFIDLSIKGKNSKDLIRKERKFKTKNPIKIEFPKINSDDEKITISRVGKLEYGVAAVDNEFEVNEYFVSKENDSGDIKQFVVFSNIDLVRVQEDFNYTSLVRSLLKDSSVKMANEYLSGYIGEISDKDNFCFEPTNIAACMRFKEFLKMQEEKSKQDNGDIDL